MAAKKTAKKTDADSQPGFEQALEELEQLVEAMENEELPLEQLVANYEKGSKLLAHCQTVLDSARERIELITLENQQDSGLEHPAASDDVEATDDDDIRLL